MSALYVMEYMGAAGLGAGVLYIGKGEILGADSGLLRYEGTYTEGGGRLIAEATITATRSGSSLVTGALLEPGHALPIRANWPTDFATGQALSATVGGMEVRVSLQKIGDIP